MIDERLYREVDVCPKCGMTEAEYDRTGSMCYLGVPHIWFVPVSEDHIIGQRQADYTHGWKDCMERFGIKADEDD